METRNRRETGKYYLCFAQDLRSHQLGGEGIITKTQSGGKLVAQLGTANTAVGNGGAGILGIASAGKANQVTALIAANRLIKGGANPRCRRI